MRLGIACLVSFAVSFLFIGRAGAQDVGIWDNNLTQGRSGVEGDLGDEKNSDWKSGLKTPNTWFFIPPKRQFADVDLDEVGAEKAYRYATDPVVLLNQTVRVQGRWIPKGYYQVKLGDANDGSLNVQLASTAQAMPQMIQPVQAGGRNQPLPQPPAFSTFVFKKLGKVVAVVPISTVAPFTPPKKEKRKYKQPVAMVELENQVPVLKIYYKQMVYAAPLSDEP
jgi:hypothetical protein